MRKRNKTYLMNKHTWIAIQKLLQKGYSLQEAVKMLDILVSFTQEGTLDFSKIKKDALTTKIQEYTKVFSYEKAIAISLRQVHVQQELKKKLMKESTYPLILLISSFSLTRVFISSILPQMLSMFDVPLQIGYLVNILQLLTSILGIVLIGAGVLMLQVFIFKNKTLMSYALRVPFLQSYYAYELCLQLDALIHYNIATNACFQYLDVLYKNHPYHDVVKSMNQKLRKGESFHKVIVEEEMLSKLARKMLHLGIQTNDISFFLTVYYDLQEVKWMQQIKKMTTTIQAIAYGMVGVVVLVVYQIMLLPLQMLETF